MLEESFLLRFFEEFYEEICRQKKRAQVSSFRPDIAQLGDEEATVALVRDISNDLCTMLDNQHAQVLHNGGDYALALYKEVQYAMVALADELLLSTHWTGQKIWEMTILEQKVFNSHVAGEVIYDKIEQMLQQQDVDKKDIAVVYLLTLGLGFRGKYAENDAQIESVKTRLFLFIHHSNQRLSKPDYVLFPKCYEALLENDAIRQLPSAKVWHGLLWVMTVFGLLLTYSFWFSSTKEIHSITKQIISISGMDRS